MSSMMRVRNAGGLAGFLAGGRRPPLRLFARLILRRQESFLTAFSVAAHGVRLMEPIHDINQGGRESLLQQHHLFDFSMIGDL